MTDNHCGRWPLERQRRHLTLRTANILVGCQLNGLRSIVNGGEKGNFGNSGLQLKFGALVEYCKSCFYLKVLNKCFLRTFFNWKFLWVYCSVRFASHLQPIKPLHLFHWETPSYSVTWLFLIDWCVFSFLFFLILLLCENIDNKILQFAILFQN